MLSSSDMSNETPGGTTRVVRSDNRIRFFGGVDAPAHRAFLRCLTDISEHGYEDCVLDFAACEQPHLWGMLPVLADVERLRRGQVSVEIILPEDERCRRLFHDTNWAHYLDPARYEQAHPEPTGTGRGGHVPTHRFTDRATQQELVNASLDVLMRNLALDRRSLAALEWSLNEITDNVLNHAESPDGGLVQVHTFPEEPKVEIGIADSGQGVLASLRQGHAHLSTDEDALREAMRHGTTRDPRFGQGNGLWGTMSLAKASGGKFEITSGAATLTVSDKVTPYRRDSRRRFKGTFVWADFRPGSGADFEEVLGVPGSRADFIETAYETDDGHASVLRLAEESSGFGTRWAGRELRTKCRNLLDAAPEKPLLLDWEGIALVSSSFADELMGKLFVELTPLEFAARVRSKGMEPLVRGLVDKAILQRAAQAVAENDPTSSGLGTESGAP